MKILKDETLYLFILTVKNITDNMVLILQKTLKWGSWMYYWMLYTGSSALAACDYVGESLANLLGITSPKYQYEIDEYKRCEKEVRLCLLLDFQNLNW